MVNLYPLLSRSSVLVRDSYQVLNTVMIGESAGCCGSVYSGRWRKVGMIPKLRPEGCAVALRHTPGCGGVEGESGHVKVRRDTIRIILRKL